MAGSKSDYLENKLLDHVLRNTAYSSPSAVYVGLYTVAPTDAGGGTEVSGGSYQRKSASFSTASNGATANASDVTFNTPTANWGTVVAFGVFDAQTSGNLLYWGDLLDGNGSPTSKVINAEDTVIFLAGSLDITEA